MKLEDRITPIEIKECVHTVIKNELDDEFHYILDCPFFEQDRTIYIPKYYYSRPTILKYKLLFSFKKKSELIKLSKFIIT